MPQRTLNLLAALAGLVVLAAFLFVGSSLHRTARTGPLWRRRLGTAALMLLAAMGLVSCGRQPDEAAVATKPAPPDDGGAAAPKVVPTDEEPVATRAATPAQPETADPAASLEESPDWQRIVDAWQLVEPLVQSGESATAQRTEASEELEAADQAMSRLVDAGLLAESEAGLLRSESKRLSGEIYKNPPTDIAVTCYDMVFISPGQESFERLSKRLPLLKQLVKGGEVHPVALERVLSNIEADLAVLAEKGSLDGSEVDPKKAQTVCSDVEAALAKIKDLIGPNGTE